MGNNSRIMLSGGTLTATGIGMLHLDSAYSVTYLATSATAGAELTGSGLDSITLNTPGSVTLSAATTVSGLLTLTAGNLMLNGQTLTFTGAGNFAASGAGAISSTAASNITVNTMSSLTGALRFAAGANDLNNLMVNIVSGGSVALGSDLNANGIVTLSNGSLSLNGHTLTFNAASDLSASGTGKLAGSLTSNLVVYATSGLTGALRFASGSNMLNDLTVNTGAASDVMLGSDLTTNGMLTLTSGILSLNGNTLTLGTAGNVASSGTGSIMGSTTSDLVINSAAGLTGALRFATGGNTLNNLRVNTGSSGSAFLGSDLNINGMLTMTAGTLSLNGHNLVFNAAGNLAASGTGAIYSSATSNIIVNATTGLTGAIRFTAGGNIVNNLTINTGSGGNVSLGSDLVADGMVTLTNGTLSLNGHNLTFGAMGDLSATGVGAIMGSATSGITVNTTGSLGSPLRFATGGNVLGNLTINATSGGNVSLSSDLMIDGTLSLSTGTLMLNGNTLTFGTTGDLAAAGSGTIMGSATSDIVVNSTAGLTGMLRFASSGNSLNDLTVNTAGASSISLGSDLIVNGVLNLQSGKIKLSTNNLSIATTGSITGGSSSSYVMTNGTGKLVMNLASSAMGTFPVGTVTNYAPMAITASSAATTGDVSINVADGVLSGGTTGTSFSDTGAMVNATWFVTSSASTINYTMKAMWSASMEVNSFDRTHAYISHYTGGSWDTYPASAATTSGSMYAITRTGITSLSPFAVRGHAITTGAPLVTVAQPVVSVYPNPATNVLHFTSSANVDKVCVYDMAGKCILAANADNGNVNISNLPAGAYVVSFTGENISVTQHFVKG